MTRTVVITGATRGIGRALALQLAGPDVRLVLTGRSTRERPDKRLPGTLEEITELVQDCGSEVVPVTVDLADGEQVTALGARLVDEAVDVLVNNAAISYVGQFLAVPPARWRTTLAVNLLAPAELTHAVLPGMLERGSGVVLNVGSGAAYIDTVPQLPYSTSKLALERLTTGLAAQVDGQGVAVTLMRIDEVVVTEAVQLVAPELAHPESVSAEQCAGAMAWMLEHPSQVHGKCLPFDELRALGALAA